MAKDPPIIETPDGIALDRGRGLAIIDVDEVLALFVQGFNRYLRTRGHEWRLLSFALFTNIYELGGGEPVSLDRARELYEDFFAMGCGEIEPAPGAAAGLARLAEVAQVVILTNTPEPARHLRTQWLLRHGMDYPLILSEGVKGPPVAILAAKVDGPIMFVDDLMSNLDSVAEAAPRVVRFQMVADPALREVAPARPHHPRVNDWSDLASLGRALFAA